MSVEDEFVPSSLPQVNSLQASAPVEREDKECTDNRKGNPLAARD